MVFLGIHDVWCCVYAVHEDTFFSALIPSRLFGQVRRCRERSRHMRIFQSSKEIESLTGTGRKRNGRCRCRRVSLSRPFGFGRWEEQPRPKWVIGLLRRCLRRWIRPSGTANAVYQRCELWVVRSDSGDQDPSKFHHLGWFGRHGSHPARWRAEDCAETGHPTHLFFGSLLVGFTF